MTEYDQGFYNGSMFTMIIMGGIMIICAWVYGG